MNATIRLVRLQRCIYKGIVKGIIMINCEVNLILTWSANCEITS